MRRLAACLCLLMAPAAARADGLTIGAPWLRYLLPTLPAAGYLMVHNAGAAPAVLTGAASPACGMLMLHRSMENSGTSMMMGVTSITVPAGGSVAFTPGGYHLMCMRPRMKVGARVEVTLIFASGARVSALAPVYGAGGAP